jgi:integrase
MAEKIALDDRTLKALRPGTATWNRLWHDEHGNKRQRPIMWDALVPGLGVRMSDKGKRVFVLVKRFGGKNPTPREIGEYGAITLESARKKAREWIELLQRGVDPALKEAEDRDKEQDRRADTFGGAFELFVRQHLATLRTGKDVEIIMRRVLLPKWGKKPLSDIARKDVIGIVYELHDDGSPIAANRVLAYIKKFFAWAVERGKLDASPAALVKKPAKERKRDRVLTDQEIRAIWLGCARLGPAGRAVQFMLATATRRNEAGRAIWQEIDRDARVWRLPADRTKADRSHEIPLNGPALACLEPTQTEVARPVSKFVFTTTGRTAVAGWSKVKAAVDREALVELRKATPTADVVLADWTFHDLRRSAATSMARLGVDRIVISKVLNHADPSVTAVYDRHGRDREIAEAYAKWGRRLEQIIGNPTDSATVVPFPGSGTAAL